MNIQRQKFKKCLLSSIVLLSLSASSYAFSQSVNFKWKSDLNENLTNITKRAGFDNFTIDEKGQLWAGVGPNNEPAGTTPLYYSRIPALTVTDDNKLVAMFDLRWNKAADQDRIDPGIAISSDGGYSWQKKTAWTFNDSKSPTRRAMDATILYNPIDGSLYAMHGTWSSGTRNWYQDRFNYFSNNIWAATIYKSTDGGQTWEKNAEFSNLVNSQIFQKVQKSGSPTIGFLGGVGSGIVMRDGTLVFPIQTAHKNGIATTIMYSKDNGKTWDMPAITNALAPNQSSLENMVFEIGNKLVMTGREDNSSKKRWAYYSEDLGKTWHVYNPVNGFSETTAAPSQGSSIYVTLPSGRRVLFVSKPNGLSDGYKRGNIALWMLDAKDPSHKYQVAIIRPGSGNGAGAGYSSLAYKEGNLFVAFEDDGNIRVKNLTEYMASIEAKAKEWNLPDEIATEVAKINALTHLNQGQKDELIAKMRRANDNAIAQSIAIDKAMNKLKIDSAKLAELAKALTKALPSKQKAFGNALHNVNDIARIDNGTYLDYLGIQDLYNGLSGTFLALNTKLDFSKYTQYVEKFNEYNHDIIYRTFDDLFVSYDAGTRHNKLSLGINKTFSDNLQAGLFMEYRNKNQKNQQFGIRAKYTWGNNRIAGFVRYRGVKHSEFIERNKNVDAYLTYAYQIKVDDKLSISPSVGAYLSRSSRTLIDDDVAMNKRTVYAGDIGVNITYKLDDINVVIRPNVAFVKDDATLSQSNDSTNQYKIDSSNTVYGLTTGIEKRFANGLSIASNVRLQRYGSQHSDVSIGLDLGYNF
ncbi:sialidase-1 [Cricetibacter osteomyelitidis]|uniref:exo-alpha-sialidase n=1 Tax=Cricetibacter osteomyelitidis TaxID=1521931 RepID=A0A4R2SRI4_9PAST|nr:exo-alpha-sialidase [Cricetibacter osteomyelitidis]TCP91211.1 sialidase-1 [Cricetibacter osteomyelitidis]